MLLERAVADFYLDSMVKVAIYDVMMMKITNGAEIASGVEMFACQMSVSSFIIVF